MAVLLPIATDEVAWSVCVHDCVSVGHVRESCKNISFRRSGCTISEHLAVV